MKKKPTPPDVDEKAYQARLAKAERALAKMNSTMATDKLNHADAEDAAKQFENAHTAKVEEVIQEHGPRIQAAENHIKVAERVDKMLDEAPETAMLGPRAILYQGLKHELTPKVGPRRKSSDPDGEGPSYTVH